MNNLQASPRTGRSLISPISQESQLAQHQRLSGMLELVTKSQRIIDCFVSQRPIFLTPPYYQSGTPEIL